MVRSSTMLVLRDIVVPVDFEPTSYHALTYARNLAWTFGARLHVLHVLEDSFALPAGTEGALSEFPRLEREVEGEVRDRLNALLSDADRSAGFVTVARLGPAPASAIVEYAREARADVIVMGTRNGAVLDTLGSVADQVIRTAPCPVLTMRQLTPSVQAATLTTAGVTELGRPAAGA
jgi:nucleotide-binding universal stress UspA family protein